MSLVTPARVVLFWGMFLGNFDDLEKVGMEKDVHGIKGNGYPYSQLKYFVYLLLLSPYVC